MTCALVTRPREDSEGVSRELRARGLTVTVEPLLDIAYLDAAINAEGVQGILATSANGVRALARLLPDRSLPVWAVGDASAREARALGYERVESAGGDVHTLAALVKDRCEPGTGAFLHAAGSVTAGDLAGLLAEAGFAVRRVVLYEARTATALSDDLTQALRNGGIGLALFFSPRTAATFVTLVQAAGLSGTVRPLTAYALSRAVADKLAPLSWAAVRVAAVPTQAALLAALEEDLAAGRISSDLQRSSMTETPPAAANETKTPSPEAAPEAADAIPAPATEEEVATEEAEIAEPEVAADAAKGRGWVPVVAAVTVVAVAGVAALVWSEMRTNGGTPSPLAPVLSSAEPAASGPVAAPAAVSPDLAAELAATRDRLAALEARLGHGGAAAVDLSPLESRVGQTETAVKALQALPQVPAKLVDEVTELSGAVAELKRTSADAAAVLRLADRVEKAESAVRDMQARRSSAAALLLAVGQLREAVAAALPYDGELRALKALAGADPEVVAAAETLKSHAAVGIPTLAMLTQRMTVLAPAVVRAQILPEGQGWWRQTLDRLGSLVTIEREDGAAAGTSPAAVVARAQGALAVGDLGTAATELEALSGPPAEVAAPWLADARARLAAGQALSGLTAHVVAAIGAGQ